MLQTTTNDLIFTNKHQSRTHKCTVGHIDISMAEVLYFYKTTVADEHQTQISRTPLMVLAQNMTDEQIIAAKFTKEQMDAFLAGSYEAVMPLRGDK